MFMSKEITVKLGWVIGKVELVDTDTVGACFGQFLRLRISIDITKLLKKLIELEQKGDDEEDILLHVMYERLPDFYFYCGRIRHRYK